MSPDISDVTAAIRAGGTIVSKYFGKSLETVTKSSAGDLRTQADTEAEQAIIIALELSFPTYNIYAEESGLIDRGSDYTFVVDPLDGTNNFVLGIPDFAISIGLLKNDEAILGVIYNPIIDHLYTAEKGKGAYLNSTRIHVNDEAKASNATISYTCGYNTDVSYSDTVKSRLRDLPVKRILETWAPAYDYCLLAAGRLEAVISREGDLEDYAAAKIIVAEAGGTITGFTNKKVNGREPNFIASNGTALRETLVDLLP